MIIMVFREKKMNRFYCLILILVLGIIHNVSAREYSKVDHCENDEATRVEICYDKKGRLLDGYAVEGEHPKSAAKHRRKMRENAKKGLFIQNANTGETFTKGSEPYTLSKFKRGRKKGLSRTIDSHQFIIKTVQYSDGRKDGIYEEYYPNHQMKVLATYKNGLLEGKATFYNNRSHKIGQAIYKNGKLLEAYCKLERKKHVYTSSEISSYPENELLNCQKIVR